MVDENTGATPDTEDAPLGDGGRKALEAERAARREAEKRLKTAEERLAALEAERMRAEIAAERGVPADLLRGSTREELEAFADRLVEFRDANKPTPRLGRPVEKLIPVDKLVPGASPMARGNNAASVADRIFSR